MSRPGRDVATPKMRANGTEAYEAPDGGQYRVTRTLWRRRQAFAVRRYTPYKRDCMAGRVEEEYRGDYKGGLPCLVGHADTPEEAYELVRKSMARVRRKIARALAS